MSIDVTDASQARGRGRGLGRRLALTGAMLALSTVGMAGAAGTALAQSSVNGQTVLGTASEPYVCLDSSCSNPWQNSSVVQRTPDNTPDSNQQFIIGNVVTGNVIDDPNWSQNPGTQIDQWSENDGDNQKWEAVPSTGANAGYDTIVNRDSGLCLDVYGSETTEGAPVIQWTCTGNTNQQWKITESPDSSLPGGYEITFTNKNSGLNLAASGGQQGAGMI